MNAIETDICTLVGFYADALGDCKRATELLRTGLAGLTDSELEMILSVISMVSLVELQFFRKFGHAPEELELLAALDDPLHPLHHETVASSRSSALVMSLLRHRLMAALRPTIERPPQ